MPCLTSFVWILPLFKFECGLKLTERGRGRKQLARFRFIDCGAVVPFMVEQNKQHIKNLKNLFVQLKWQALAQQIPIKTSTQADSELRSVRCESKFCKQQYAPSFFYIHFLGSEWIPRTEFNSNESFAFRMLKHSIAFGVNAN